MSGYNRRADRCSYTAHFKPGRIDVFDSKYNPTSVAGGFADLPAGDAPYKI